MMYLKIVLHEVFRQNSLSLVYFMLIFFILRITVLAADYMLLSAPKSWPFISFILPASLISSAIKRICMCKHIYILTELLPRRWLFGFPNESRNKRTWGWGLRCFRPRTPIQATSSPVSNQANFEFLCFIVLIHIKMKIFSIIVHAEPIWYLSNLSLIMVVKNFPESFLFDRVFKHIAQVLPK